MVVEVVSGGNTDDQKEAESFIFLANTARE